jgi:myo-inositol-1(or 4)-monophosphatase
MTENCPYEISSLLKIAIEAAQEAGAILRNGFGTSFQIRLKSGKQNVVTEYDQRAEESIIKYLSTHSPDHTFLGEETGLSSLNPRDENILWIIDPIDGTTNFAHQIPLFCVSIAAKWKGKTLCGVVYQPLTNELFYASIGGGAFLNGNKIQVTQVNEIEKAVIATGFPHEEDSNYAIYMNHLYSLLKFSPSIRDMGSAALHLAYVASGSFDAFWIPRVYLWDVAAGQLIVEEAGGRVTHWTGAPISNHELLTSFDLLCTNGHILQKEFLKIIKQS